MSTSVYTYAELMVSPYTFEQITELKIMKRMNDHAVLTLVGIVPEDKLDQYVERADDEERIQIKVQDSEHSIVLFEGVVTHLAVEVTRQVRKMTIEASSATILMDMRPESRSFQNTGMTYQKLMKRLTASYPAPDVSDEATKGAALGDLVVQYKETDWAFIRRLASRFHAPLVPVCNQSGVKFVVGLPDLGEPKRLEEFNYTIHKNLREYKLKSERGELDITEQNTIRYDVHSTELLELGSPVSFGGRSLYVHEAQTAMENGILMNRYILGDKEGISCLTEYPYALAGVSLFGKILSVSKDKVKVHLDIDDDEPSTAAMWFPYSTVYSSPDGSGWYCMPEVGDEVRLYFPDEQEGHAFAASSVDVATSDPVKRGDPSVKSISTKYGKQVVFRPGAVEVIGGEKLLMKLTDDGGIELSSDKKIVLNAVEDIEINGAKVVIQGESGIDLKQTDTNLLRIEDQVTISGSKVNIE
jgi:hypothetical protein